VETTVTGLLKGNGTAVSAATSGTDYAPATSGSSALKGNGSGGFATATINDLGSQTADYSANSHKITSLANGSASSDAAAIGQTATGIMTTLGDVLYENSTPAPARLAGNTTSTKKFLTQTGTGSVSAAPAWGTIATGDVPTLNQNTTGTAANITGTLDQVPAPAANVSLNSHKITSLANGSASSDAAAFGQIPIADTTTGDIQASPGTAAAGSNGKWADSGHVHPQPTVFAPTGLTGATAASRYVGATTSGAPASGTFLKGDFVIDQTASVWICTTAGSPGTWTAVSGGVGGVSSVSASDSSVTVTGSTSVSVGSVPGQLAQRMLCV
jgi:hypothetical protein